MSLDLELDDAQQAIAAAIEKLCRDRCRDEDRKAAAGGFPHELWRDLAELGVLALVTPEGDGGALELCAALEPLGRAAFPGPLVGTFLAAQLLPRDERLAVASGDAVVSVGEGALLPWAPAAALFVELDLPAAKAWLARPRGPVEAVETLGGEPWGRVGLDRVTALGDPARALPLADLARAAYLAAAGRRIVDAAAEHARARRQFGRPIGDFQAVAHPLADCAVQLDAAATLARIAAFRFDCDRDRHGDDARAAAAGARLSAAAAALRAVYAGHQAFGALGVTLEGPIYHVSRRIRQVASEPPGEAAARCAVLARRGRSVMQESRP